MAGINSGEETVDLICVATEQPVTTEDIAQHGVLFVLKAGPGSENGLGGDTIAVIKGDVVKNAKTIRLVLTRDSPDENFRGWQFQCVETFREEPPEY